jgi:hypothetical protein
MQVKVFCRLRPRFQLRSISDLKGPGQARASTARGKPSAANAPTVITVSTGGKSTGVETVVLATVSMDDKRADAKTVVLVTAITVD